MRGIFIKTLTELAGQDERIVLLTADLGYTVLEQFSSRYPDRYFNVGVAEQNMVGISTGLAEAGYIPFLYSIGTFASLRGYEFLRNGPILHQLPVRVIGVGGGLEYSTAGTTHHSIDDVGVMRVQPGIRVIAPADYEQTGAALRTTWNLPEPIYFRIGKNDKITVPGLDGRFDLNTATHIGSGRDLLFVASGGVTSEVVSAADQLRAEGIDSTVAVVASLNPAPELVSTLDGFPHVISVEDHFITGGVGSLVAEVIAENGLGCRLTRCGISTPPDGITGSLKAMRERYGLSAEKLAATTRALLLRAG
jgi:transketolase